MVAQQWQVFYGLFYLIMRSWAGTMRLFFCSTEWDMMVGEAYAVVYIIHSHQLKK